MLLQSISRFGISKLGSALGPPILSSSQNKGTCWSQWSAGRRLLFSQTCCPSVVAMALPQQQHTTTTIHKTDSCWCSSAARPPQLLLPLGHTSKRFFGDEVHFLFVLFFVLFCFVLFFVVVLLLFFVVIFCFCCCFVFCFLFLLLFCFVVVSCCCFFLLFL